MDGVVLEEEAEEVQENEVWDVVDLFGTSTVSDEPKSWIRTVHFSLTLQVSSSHLC